MSMQLPPIDTRTRQFLQSICAQAQSQWVTQRMHLEPSQAVQAHAPLSMKTVLDLLQE